MKSLIKTQKLLSIGMPVYNGAKFIDKSIHSLLAQKYDNFELIISDNASTDETKEICLKYAKLDGRIRYIRQENNIGASANFQYVLGEATGEYFMWAAADDMWDKNWAYSLLEALDDEIFISFGGLVNIDEKDRILKKYNLSNFSGNKILRLFRFYLEEDTKGKANFIYGMYKLAALKKIGFDRFGSDGYGEDMRFVFTCLHNGKIISDPSVLMYKRVENEKLKIKTYKFKKIVKEIFILYRIDTYLKYSNMIDSIFLRFTIYLLFPFKYILSIFFNLFNKLYKFNKGN